MRKASDLWVRSMPNSHKQPHQWIFCTAPYCVLSVLLSCALSITDWLAPGLARRSISENS